MVEGERQAELCWPLLFTKQFEDKGFKWDVYVKTDDLKDFTDYPLLVCPTLLLREKKCPLFKRRSFMHELEAYLNDTAGEPVQELYEAGLSINQGTAEQMGVVLPAALNARSPRWLKRSRSIRQPVPISTGCPITCSCSPAF